MNTAQIIAAIEAGRPSLREITALLQAIERATKRHGTKPSTPGSEVCFYVEHAIDEAKWYADEEEGAHA